MTRLNAIAQKVRSKNAGPFWITIDIFCGSADAFARVTRGLSTDHVARVLNTDQDALKRFDMPDLNVIKISLPRPQVQGTRFDRDMHGAALGELIGEMEID